MFQDVLDVLDESLMLAQQVEASSSGVARLISSCMSSRESGIQPPLLLNGCSLLPQ